MNTLIDRLIIYVNTCLKKDVNYDIARYIIEHYLDFEQMSLKKLCEECYVSRASIIRFCDLFGFPSWKSFHQFLLRTKKIKESQMEDRFHKLDIEKLYLTLGYISSNTDERYIKKLKEDVQMVVDALKQGTKIYMFGAIYPLSIATAFQIDMIASGKVVYSDFQSEDNEIEAMNADDLAIILTSTGRYISECKGKFNAICHAPAKRMLLSCSNQYAGLQSINHYVHIRPTKEQGVKGFDYYLMAFLDLVFVQYYLQQVRGIKNEAA